MSTVVDLGRKVRRKARAEGASYAHGEDRPLGGYVAAMATYSAGIAGLTALAWRRGDRLPADVSWSDLSLVALATHKAARLLAKDPVSSPLRVPFAKYEGRSGESELAEEPKPGHRHAVGELVTCPFCLGQWLATGFAFGLVMAPRPTRFAMGILAARAGADVLQFGYDALQQAVTGDD